MNARLPTYALYGETSAAADLGWLHCESIAERSRLHDWEIRAHRHEALFQLLVIRSGRFTALLDEQELELRGPCVVTVPALVVHGFHFSPDVDGVVVTMLEQRVLEQLRSEPLLAQRVVRPQGQPLSRAAGIDAWRTTQALLREYHGHERWRSLGVDGTLLHLLVQAARALHDDGPLHAAARRAPQHVQRFRALVNQRFREQPSMAACAAALGITPTQLNRLCHEVLGHNALGVLHARLLLEAQRELAYTTMSVKQIAFGLGFSDAGYFTRFFQRLCGRSPRDWRADAAARHAAHVAR